MSRLRFSLNGAGRMNYLAWPDFSGQPAHLQRRNERIAQNLMSWCQKMGLGINASSHPESAPGHGLNEPDRRRAG